VGHDCEIIGYCRTEESGQETSVMFDPEIEGGVLRVFHQGRVLFVPGIKYCPFCGANLQGKL